MFLSVNRKILDDPAAAQNYVKPEFLLQKGVFETLRIYGGRPFRLREHLERFAKSADLLQLDPGTDIEGFIQGEISRAVGAGLNDSFLRITLVHGTLVTLIDALPTLDARWYAEGIRIGIAETPLNEFSTDSGIKTTNTLQSILAFRGRGRLDADDLVFLDTEGHLSEATAANLFFISDGTVFTPPLTCGALPGITRKTVLEILARVGIPSSDMRPLYLQELESASEVFLTSSIREIVPVTTVAGRTIGTGKPGLLTRGLMNNYTKATRCS